MARKERYPLLKKDLQMVILYVVLVIMFISLLEARYYGQEEQDTTPGGGDGVGAPEDLVMVDIDVMARDGFTQEGGSTEEGFRLDYRAVTSVDVEVTWTDDIGSNDLLRLTLRHEGEDVGTDEGTSGSLTVSIGDTVDGALFGNYTVLIEAVDCPGMVGPLPVDRDTGNSWDLRVRATVSEDEGDG